MKLATKIDFALPVGTVLNDYTITRVLSLGGFSFVYLAQDSQKHTVAIKEYMPVSLAEREGTTEIRSNGKNEAAFKHGMKCFFEEGLALANIEHKNIVRVQNFFRANNTVYMVMKYERGKSLQDYIMALPNAVPENFLIRMFVELLNGLREVHTRKLLHMDIKPANIYIRLDGSPVLLDFGSARQALSEVTLAPTFTPGFAPPEQYYDRKHLGPWSDIYSIGASMYACMQRTSPQPADMRMKTDSLVPAMAAGKQVYSEKLLAIIDHCMQLDYMLRPQSVFSLQKKMLAVRVIDDPRGSLVDKIIKVLTKPL
ncbi:serine/threonine protein kinase [Methylophilus aquaticus]|uniref:Serine/threonine-protein kinase n=1 Tax=Methylophilus aquaticus TaxID=1971610 RepID=A0ABT9JNU6_9PROT|nr:serine/threonine-protein kinase [Methylophilus aquaticus]MDP8566269.1 serine/threonine-protein kinase [Methylophilus aquaticus]